MSILSIPNSPDLKRLRNLVLLVVGLLLVTGCASLVRPNYETDIEKLRSGAYELDPAHSFLIFKINHLGLSTYVGRFNELEATLDFDPDTIEATRLSSRVSLSSIDVNDAELEERLRGNDWFFVSKYPYAEFETAAVISRRDGPADKTEEAGRYVFTGELTFRGVTKAIELTARFNGGADNLLTQRYTLGFTATGSFLRSDFGMDQLSGLIGDRVDIEVFAEFLRIKK